MPQNKSLNIQVLQPKWSFVQLWL